MAAALLRRIKDQFSLSALNDRRRRREYNGVSGVSSIGGESEGRGRRPHALPTAVCYAVRQQYRTAQMPVASNSSKSAPGETGNVRSGTMRGLAFDLDAPPSPNPPRTPRNTQLPGEVTHNSASSLSRTNGRRTREPTTKRGRMSPSSADDRSRPFPLPKQILERPQSVSTAEVAPIPFNNAVFGLPQLRSAPRFDRARGERRKIQRCFDFPKRARPFCSQWGHLGQERMGQGRAQGSGERKKDPQSSRHWRDAAVAKHILPKKHFSNSFTPCV